MGFLSALKSGFGLLGGGSKAAAPPPPPVSVAQVATILGPPRAPRPADDQIVSDVFAPPYRGPIDMDPYARETPAMRFGYREQYRANPIVKAAVGGKADDISVLEPTVLPADKDDPVSNMAAEFVRWTVEQAPGGWRRVIDSIYRPGSIDGYSLCAKKLKVARWKGMTVWGLDHVRQLDTAFLRLELDMYRNVTAVVNMVRGIEYFSPDQVILYTHNGMYGNPFGLSDLRAATRAGRIIEDVYKVWYVALEVYGLPYMYGKSKATNRAALGEALQAIRAGGWAVTDTEESIEVLNLASAAGNDAFEKMVHVQREDIFFAVRGVAQPFMEGDGGSDAHTDTAVQQGTSDAGERASALDVAACINEQLVPWLVRPNFGDVDMPRVKLGGTDWAQTKVIVDLVTAATAAGANPSAEWFHNATNIPPARDESDRLKPPGQGGPQPGQPGQQPAPHPRPAPAAHNPANKHLEEVKPGVHRWVAHSEGVEQPAAKQFSDAALDFPTAWLVADPARFQFRRGHDAADGTVRDLPAERFDRKRCEELLGWHDPADGRDYVVDGHHRLAWAERDGAARVPVRFVQAATAEEARAIGERANRDRPRALPAATAQQPATFSDQHRPDPPAIDAGRVAATIDRLLAEFGVSA